MKDFVIAKILNQVWSLVLISLLALISACNTDDPEGPNLEEKCFGQPEMAWAMGERYSQEGNQVKYVEIPPFDPSAEEGKQVKWLELKLESGNEFLGAVKFRELTEGEIPEGASPGEFIKLLIRIENPKWYFVPEVNNVKVEGYETSPSEVTKQGQFNTHKGIATQETGDEWEYYIVVLPRFNFYAINVEAQKEVACSE